MNSSHLSICQIIPALGAGGAEQGCIDVAAGIRSSGGDSFVISHGGARIPELLRHGTTHINLPVHSKNPITAWKNYHEIRKLIREKNIKLIHVRSRAPAWSAYYAARAENIPFITTCHAPYNIKNNEWKRKYNSIMARGDRVIAISEFVQKYLLDNYNIDEKNIRLIPRGVDIDKFHPSKVTSERMIKLTQQWRIPDGARVILLPGRLTRWKGQSVLINAMAQIKDQDLFAVLIGSDQGRTEYRTELENLIRAKNLEHRVRVTDHCNDMPAAYSLATIACSASTDPEGFGRISIEAQAMGRMMIASNHGGSTETIMHDQTGWLVNPNDATDLARMIDHVLHLNDKQKNIISENAINHIHGNFTKDLMVQKTLDVYRELI
jgi:glycosyltransferase involved in cell wall biosynthesis